MAELVPDDLDRALIEVLAADPRLSYVAIGKRVGVSGTTAAARLDRLREGGLLSIQALPDLERWGLASEILGTVEVEAAAIGEVSAFLTKSPYVLRADHVTGDFNLSFLGAFPSDSVLGAFLRALQTHRRSPARGGASRPGTGQARRRLERRSQPVGPRRGGALRDHGRDRGPQASGTVPPHRCCLGLRLYGRRPPTAAGDFAPQPGAPHYAPARRGGHV